MRYSFVPWSTAMAWCLGWRRWGLFWESFKWHSPSSLTGTGGPGLGPPSGKWGCGPTCPQVATPAWVSRWVSKQAWDTHLCRELVQSPIGPGEPATRCKSRLGLGVSQACQGSKGFWEAAQQECLVQRVKVTPPNPASRMGSHPFSCIHSGIEEGSGGGGGFWRHLKKIVPETVVWDLLKRGPWWGKVICPRSHAVTQGRGRTGPGFGQASEPPPTVGSVFLYRQLYKYGKKVWKHANQNHYFLPVILKGGRGGMLLLSMFSHSCIDSFFSPQLLLHLYFTPIFSCFRVSEKMFLMSCSNLAVFTNGSSHPEKMLHVVRAVQGCV